MNDKLEFLKNRTSCRSFTEEIPSRELLEQIAEAGIYAASGSNKQGVKVIFVTNKELRDKLEDLNRKAVGMPEDATPFYGAPVVAVVLGNKDVATYVYDGSLVLGNMMLAADALDLGNCWIHRAKQEFETEEGKALLKQLGIEGEWEGIGNFIVGYRAGEKAAPKERLADRIYFVE